MKQTFGPYRSGKICWNIYTLTAVITQYLYVLVKSLVEIIQT